MGAPVSQLKPQRGLRRSKRLGLAVRVCIDGQNAFGEPFREFTRTLSINAYGGLIALAAPVEKGQTILLQNTKTREERAFRVVDVGLSHDGKRRVGIELAHARTNFWRVFFPLIG